MNHWLRRLLPIAAVLTTAGVLVANQVGASAYTSGSTGYDISYPQCGGHYPTGAFGIVGVNGGYPFVHYNPCLADEYNHTTNAALYINTGYDPIYTQVDGQHSIVECVTQGVTIQGNWTVAEPRLSRGQGSLSGRMTFASNLATVRAVAKAAKGRIAVKASGGVFTGGDALQMIEAGATMIDVFTAFIYRGWNTAANRIASRKRIRFIGIPT